MEVGRFLQALGEGTLRPPHGPSGRSGSGPPPHTTPSLGRFQSEGSPSTPRSLDGDCEGVGVHHAYCVVVLLGFKDRVKFSFK